MRERRDLIKEIELTLDAKVTAIENITILCYVIGIRRQSLAKPIIGLQFNTCIRNGLV